MKVLCLQEHEEAARAAGHEPVRDGTEEALSFPELPKETSLLRELAGQKVICPAAGLDATEDFDLWLRGYEARRDFQVRLSQAGEKTARPVNRRKISPRTELLIRSMIKLGLPKKRIARENNVTRETVERVQRSMEHDASLKRSNDGK